MILMAQCVARTGVARNCPSRGEVTRDEPLVGLHERLATEEAVVDALGVGLDVAREALEHLADRLARVGRLELEKDMVLIGKNDEEVPFAVFRRLMGPPFRSMKGPPAKEG
jgi:hypothetical protein